MAKAVFPYLKYSFKLSTNFILSSNVFVGSFLYSGAEDYARIIHT